MEERYTDHNFPLFWKILVFLSVIKFTAKIKQKVIGRWTYENFILMWDKIWLLINLFILTFMSKPLMLSYISMIRAEWENCREQRWKSNCYWRKRYVIIKCVLRICPMRTKYFTAENTFYYLWLLTSLKISDFFGNVIKTKYTYFLKIFFIQTFIDPIFQKLYISPRYVEFQIVRC